jgi:F-type H+-transporting ATPase subunit b
MEILNQLKHLLVGAIPTFFLVWILYLYVSRFFFGPLEKTLGRRREATTGLRQTAEAALVQAEQKTAQHQEALRTARAELYRIQEQERQKALDQRAELIRQAHQRSDELVRGARQQIRDEAERAKKTLAGEADQIAAAIIQAILKPAGPSRGREANP